MNSFETQYLAILKRQVQEEINYLQLNGHSSNPVLDPCMFCVKQANGSYWCSRLSQLNQFLESIESQKGRPVSQGKVYGTSSRSEMPLMFPGF